MKAKAEHFQRDLLQKHWLDGLYVSIVPAAPPGRVLPHTVHNQATSFTLGCGPEDISLASVINLPSLRTLGCGSMGARFSGASDPARSDREARLARARYVKGHGPVEEWEREGRDSAEWHQGQGTYSDYRWYGDVSVDNFNAVLYGYAIYYDLAADHSQREVIAQDVDRLMTHLLSNHCRIIDVDGEVTLGATSGSIQIRPMMITTKSSMPPGSVDPVKQAPTGGLHCVPR